ncbi:MAG: tRNA (guanine-N(1)-)-methyltransferase [Turneriella sp.]|nr:tRNA (guanine-N(1)-)-methyltransferase [Turneriella sp.]
MIFRIVTLFPEFFASPLKASLLGKAVGSGILEVKFVNPRDFAEGKYKKVDDHPYGGGAGMVMMAEPIARAVDSIKEETPSTYVALLSARGKLWNSIATAEYKERKDITLICGHYEGVDERIAQSVADESIRIGDFVLSGGEAAALVVIDSVARKLPGFMQNTESLLHESFDGGISFEHAQYTRPEIWRGQKVPEVLLSGDHAKIAEWRRKEAEAFTQKLTKKP